MERPFLTLLEQYPWLLVQLAAFLQLENLISDNRSLFALHVGVQMTIGTPASYAIEL